MEGRVSRSKQSPLEQSLFCCLLSIVIGTVCNKCGAFVECRKCLRAELPATHMPQDAESFEALLSPRFIDAKWPPTGERAAPPACLLYVCHPRAKRNIH